MAESSGAASTHWSHDDDPNRRALASVDAVHDSDPTILNEPVARLRRFIRFRRRLYYTVLAPFSRLSRVSPLMVLVTGAAALIGAVIAVVSGAPALLVGVLLYWAIGGLSYHALSVRLASLMYDAARSVDIKSGDVLEAWKAE
ncbi:MAG: hypothetical protein KJO97_01970 [Acidimicrobiia bacterium]|nr:hypothetical protein [Acidimicrobiia bacterium]